MADTPQQTPSVPALLGGFEILDKIAEGGMGAVYRARQLSLNRVVAVKILTQTLAADAEYVSRFRREAQSAARLHHPNIISVFSAGEHDGLQFYAMEYVRGLTLYKWVQSQGALPERVAVEIGICVASALKHAWDKEKLVHGDIKPENIMVDTEGNVKLCDLGLAKRYGDATAERGRRFGTPYYVSPELARGDRAIDQRSDIYSLGMTLYFALTGVIPFGGEPAETILEKHLKGQIADPRDYEPRLSHHVCRLLERMLAKNAADRYQTWAEVLRDLELVHRNKSPQVAPLPATRSTLRLGILIPTIQLPSRMPRRQKILIIASSIAGGILLFAILVSWLLTRGR